MVNKRLKPHRGDPNIETPLRGSTFFIDVYQWLPRMRGVATGYDHSSLTRLCSTGCDRKSLARLCFIGYDRKALTHLRFNCYTTCDLQDIHR